MPHIIESKIEQEDAKNVVNTLVGYYQAVCRSLLERPYLPTFSISITLSPYV